MPCYGGGVQAGSRRLHWVLGALVCLVLPLGSWLFAGGALAYTMYSATVVYRLEVVAFDAQGRETRVLPGDLVAFTSAFAAPFLHGAEVAREVPQIDALRAHLADVARAGCRRALATRVQVALFEGAPEAARNPSLTASAECAGAP